MECWSVSAGVCGSSSPNICGSCRTVNFAHKRAKIGDVNMRGFMIVAVSCLVTCSGAAVAQITQLPTTSPSEQRVEGLNSSIQQQENRMQQDQQNQFNFNQLQLNQQEQIQRNSPSTSPFRRGCPSGSVGCLKSSNAVTRELMLGRSASSAMPERCEPTKVSRRR